MLIDLLIVCLTAAAAYWGYRQGLSTGALALIGFGGGAILGSRVAPLMLSGGFEDPFAPVLALPAALVIGALLAAGLERLGFSLRLRLRRRGTPDVVGGTVVAACVGLIAVWILGAAFARVDSLRDPIRDSAIIEQLNAAVPPPGPLLNPARARVDPLPEVSGPGVNVGAADQSVRRDPQVRAAKASVVEVLVNGCRRGTGSGWVAGEGIVVTNAHVIQGADEIQVQLGGKGDKQDAEPIWYDQDTDIGIVRTDAISGVRALPIGVTPKPGTFVATLGYPGGGPYLVGPARIGATTRIPDLRVEGRGIPGKVTAMRVTATGPGSSGGPVVNRDGRVVAMVRSVDIRGIAAYGVPAAALRRAVRRAGPTVDTG